MICYNQKEKHYITGQIQNDSDTITQPLNEEKIEARVLLQFHESMKNDISKRIKMNAPTAKYDVATKRAYLEYPDGKKVFADDI